LTSFEIVAVSTHAELNKTGDLNGLTQWADIKLSVPKDFDWQKGGPKLLKQLEAAASLIGRTDP
jgi:hypothetical protein